MGFRGSFLRIFNTTKIFHMELSITSRPDIAEGYLEYHYFDADTAAPPAVYI